MFTVYFFNHNEIEFFKTYGTERSAELAVMGLKTEGITAWIETSYFSKFHGEEQS